MITTIPELNAFLDAKTKRLEAEQRDLDHAEGLMLNAQFDQLAAARNPEEETAAVADQVASTVVETPQSDNTTVDDPIIEMVTITKAEYKRLRSAAEWLKCLEDAGVDNWDGIDYAREMQMQDL